MQNTAAGLVVIVAIAAAVFDLRARRIPNFITLPAIVAGLAITAVNGWRAFGLRLIAVALLLSAGMFLFSLHVLGGGDGKLIAAIAALQGLAFTGEALVWALLVAASVAVITLIRRSALKGALVRAMQVVTVGHATPDPDASYIPLGPAIALGAVIVLATHSAGWSVAELFA